MCHFFSISDGFTSGFVYMLGNINSNLHVFNVYYSSPHFKKQCEQQYLLEILFSRINENNECMKFMFEFNWRILISKLSNNLD